MPDDGLLPRHAHPALTRLQERLAQATRVDTVTQYGRPSDSPDVSVIVPLYGRIDFMEHQLCQFMHDPAFRDLDLMYVLDSPELAEQLSKSAAALHALYELPFRTITLNRNAGYSIANNIGASLARGRLLLLLNSDVVPDAPGWVGELTEFYDATPAIGALGPKLLYEDGSLQHAGLYFDREPGAPLWTNLHYFKGLQSDFPPANVARPVPAVTGACLMIARSTWEELDGLWPGFVQGGYEDSDLCLRLLEAGHDNWYLPHVELHHLEDQSFPSGARLMATSYNAWLQTHARGDQIERLMSDERFSAQPGFVTY
jgi:GT2 family glycosyltransferase